MADVKRNQRMELLNAIASGGTAGGEAYQQAINSAQNSKQQGLKLAADRAGAINAPQAFLARQNEMISQPLDSAVGLNQAAQSAQGQYAGAMNAAQGQYMAGVGQSRNLLQQLASKAVSGVQATAQADAQKQFKSLLREARTDSNNERTARNQDRTDVEDANKQSARNVSEEALQDLPTDYRGSDFKSLIQENSGLASALKDLEENFDGYKDGAVKEEMRDRLLQYYDPQMWLQVSTNPLAAVYKKGIADGKRPFSGAAANAAASSFVVGKPQGLVKPGNIDLNTRPTVKNEDGSISTVRSITVTDDQGNAILIPTVINGKVVSEEEAVDYFRRTGQNLGFFKSEDAANTYAESLHNAQAAQYGNK